MSPEEAQNKALELWERGLTVALTHFQERIKERNVSMPDIQYLLENGEIRKAPVFDEKHGNWRYVIEGEDCDAAPLALVFAIDEVSGELVLITVRDT